MISSMIETRQVSSPDLRPSLRSARILEPVRSPLLQRPDRPPSSIPRVSSREDELRLSSIRRCPRYGTHGATPVLPVVPDPAPSSVS